MRRLLALLHHICSSQWPVRAGVLLLPAEAVARVRSHGAPLAAPWQTRFLTTTFCPIRNWQLGRGASTRMQGPWVLATEQGPLVGPWVTGTHVCRALQGILVSRNLKERDGV